MGSPCRTVHGGDPGDPINVDGQTKRMKTTSHKVDTTGQGPVTCSGMGLCTIGLDQNMVPGGVPVRFTYKSWAPDFITLYFSQIPPSLMFTPPNSNDPNDQKYKFDVDFNFPDLFGDLNLPPNARIEANSWALKEYNTAKTEVTITFPLAHN